MGSIKGFKCNCVNPIMYSVGWMYSTKQIHLLLIMKAPPLSSKIWQKIAECLLRYGSTDGLCNSSLIMVTVCKLSKHLGVLKPSLSAH